ncbi:MAG TPA: T9SS type A sorting domain-containing protein [Candidatus Marinimicrobia bacterium]|nr:T9SS type A sorting domain-containing protein [Candidatus Neomarinimicrobiota bacterium]
MKNVRTTIIVSVIVVIIIAANSLPAEEGFTLLATMSGDSVGDEFCIVANVGDVNGDGYPDVLVGAPGGEYAKLYFGGAPFDTIPDLIFRDEKEHTRFGCSVAGGGDVNGDGYPDIVIGASSTWIGLSFPKFCIWGAGAAYVYFGGPDMDTIPDLELVVGNWEEQTGWYYGFGLPVVIAGDMNGDGYDDIVIGAANDDYDAHGRVYIYFGGPDINAEYDILLEGEDHFDNFGASIANVGDINRDGFDDVLIGAPQIHTENPGKAYLVYGGNEISLTGATVFTGDSSLHSYYGRVVAGLGDVNGDDYPDVGVMALDYIRIFLGCGDINLVPGITLFPVRDFWYIGALGDLNKDGYDDIGVVSEYFEIFLGKTIIDTIPDISFELWYSTICGLGDINNDSYLDIGLGRSGGWDPIGKVYIYSYGKPDKIKEGSSFLKDFHLYQNYPNPFNTNTCLAYTLPSAGDVTITIYNLLGKKIRTLVSGYQPSGYHSAIWDGKDDNGQAVASGIYLYQMLSTSNNFEQSPIRKMVLLK